MSRTGRPPLAGRLELVLAARFLRGHRTRPLAATARAALLATTLGVAALGLAMALMTGYRRDLAAKLVGANAAVIVYPLSAAATPSGAAGTDAARGKLAALPGVVGVEPVVFGQGVLAGPRGESEVTLRGFDPDPTSGGAGGEGLLGASSAKLAPAPDGIDGIVLGADLARELGAKAGDLVRLTALGLEDGRARFVFRSLRVRGTFSTGFAEFDQSWAVARRATVAGVSGSLPSTLEVRVEDPSRAGAVAEAARAALGEDYLVTDWRQMNRELFAALALQQRGLFLLLGLIVLVATFNVASTIVVLTRERIRDLGLLAALGLPPRAIARVLLAAGMLLGATGLAAGLALAAGLSWFLTRFEIIRFGPEVAAIYFLRSVPFRLSAADTAAIAALSLVVTFLACILPARRATRLEPAAALRYE